MANQAYPSLNGFAPSWADIKVTFTVDGGDVIEMTDIAGIKYGTKGEVGEQGGAGGGRPLVRTYGEAKYEASMTLYRSGHRQLQKALAGQADSRGNQKIIGAVAFDILIQHSVIGDSEIYVTKIKACRYMGVDDDMKEGTEADKVEVSLSTIEIVHIIDGEEIVLL
jgi:hypothetical protein